MGAIARKLIMRGWESVAVSDAELRASQTPVSGVVSEKNLSYMGDNAQSHLLDVYFPENTKGLLPAIVDIHGGGWVYGNKELNEYYCMSLAKLGFAVVNMNYTLAPEAHIDAQVREVFAALRWLDKNGSKHHIDRATVFLTGDSSGAQLAMLAAAVDRTPRLAQLYGVKKLPIDIKAVGASCGMFDLSSMFGAKPLFREMGRMLFGERPKKSPFYGNAGIIDIMNADGICPPVFLITSEGDKGLHSQTLELHSLLNSKGVECGLFDVSGEDADSFEHVYNVMYWMTDTAVSANTAMTDFFKSVAERAR